ncbi:sds23/moc1 [Sodiomyces alkalinus F11]|uniref:Protein SDS23 n=1 Tax=Sodiomyces alkalinus (strain CBS 110278 / VKM F-3762 / F11) TaxID=1314773 RepID=A0A3N2PU92_SODAK|nr:sds23/moc1 [Sodiomyces alkalinus F11]ROT37896.1 sds23/moc1 [Sodiomyces alkalinus F11]
MAADLSNTAARPGSSSVSPPAPPQRTSSQSSLTKSSSHISTHRHSFAENLRNAPGSPRSQRHPSFAQTAVQELLNNPPPAHKHSNPRFAGRDWRDISVNELVSHEDVRWANLDTSVEDASMLLVKQSPANVVLVRENAQSRTAISSFDYTDLTTYLLVVVGLANPDEDEMPLYRDIATKAQNGTRITLEDIQPICKKETLVVLPFDETLDAAIEVFGGGVHRVVVCGPSGDAVGILSQLKLIEFFWNEGINFPVIDRLYPVSLRELGISTQQIIAVNSDTPLAEALTLMNTECLTSVAVVDNAKNVVGNISTVDVKHLTNAASAPLLNSNCMHFISLILSERGVEHGRDSFPVFYVNPSSTLAHTVAKLVATQAHRMWVVESASPSPSSPATPLLSPVNNAVLVPGTGSTPPSPVPLQGTATQHNPPASALPGAHLSGRLTGVVSLTDILNLFARSSGLRPSDPGEQRARRRRSSSSSVRPSIDSARPSVDSRR